MHPERLASGVTTLDWYFWFHAWNLGALTTVAYTWAHSLVDASGMTIHLWKTPKWDPNDESTAQRLTRDLEDANMHRPEVQIIVQELIPLLCAEIAYLLRRKNSARKLQRLWRKRLAQKRSAGGKLDRVKDANVEHTAETKGLFRKLSAEMSTETKLRGRHRYKL